MIMADSLSEGIEELFGVSTDGQLQTTNTTQTSGDVSTDLITQANTLFNEAQEAQKAGDWALYGQKLDQLETVLKSMQDQISQ
jgi:uncharacterized membrane protein (UPF0182 family)